jgi:PAS domain S-box-containing protein
MNTTPHASSLAHILVVDDTIDDLRLLTNILQAQGFCVRSLAEGSLVHLSVKSVPPDIILLDIMMPDMDGYTVCKALKADAYTQHIPIIFISALDNAEDKVKGFALGGVDYIAKPFHTAEVLARVTNQLSHSQMQRQLQEQNARLQKEIEERQRIEHALVQSQQALQEANNQLEQRVAERTAHLRLAQFTLDKAADSIFWVNFAGDIEYVNDSAATLLGYTTAELCSMNVMEIDPLLSPELWHTAWTELKQRGSMTIETHQRCKDGTILQVEMTISFIAWEGQDHLCAFVRDIRERKAMQEALEMERQRLFAVLDQLPAYVYLQAPDYTIRFANRYFQEHFGDPQTQYCYQALFERQEPCTVCPPFRLYAGDTPQVWETTNSDGHIYQVYAYPFTDVDGSLLVLELGIDITERKQAEEALRQSEIALQQANSELEQRVAARTAELYESQTLFRGVLDNSPMMIFVNDLQGRYLLINRKGAEVFGMMEEEVRGKLQSELFAEDSVKRWHAEDQHVLVAQKPLIFEQNMSDESGESTFMAIKFPIANEQGVIYAIGGIITDITERKRAEENLRKFYRAVEQSSLSVVITDTHGRIEYVNPKFTQVTGYTFAEALGKNPRILKTRFTPAETHRSLWDTVLAGKEWQGEFYNRKKHGECYWESASISPIINAEGTITHFVAVKEDITERKRAQEELQQAKEHAETANRAKSTFLANMSHELRTPLNAILGFSQLMAGDTRVLAGHQEYLRIIMRSGEHLLALINDILEMSKIEAGRTSLDEHDFDLQRLLADLRDMFWLRAEEKHIQLLLEVAHDVPKYVHADQGKLRQILINLLSNAIKFTGEGSVTLRVFALAQRGTGDDGPATVDRQRIPATGIGAAEEGNVVEEHSPSLADDTPTLPCCTVHFIVEDTGVGIEPAEQVNLFEAFTQTRSGQQAQEGTGLGLAISHAFLRMMGGAITVKSVPGQGSTFSFTLPLRALQDFTELPEHQPVQQLVQLAADQPRSRILVVEDHEDNRLLLCDVLQTMGFEVQSAINGEDALVQWGSWQPQLVFMDIRMPGMDGYEATSRIKATPQGAETIVVALTASAFEEERRNILQAGCDDFIRKPFQQHEIATVLEKHLNVRFTTQTQATEEQRNISSSEAKRSFSEAGLDTAMLKTLPQAWLRDMHYAAALGSIEQSELMIGQLEPQYEPLIRQLSLLMQQFRFDQIAITLEPLIDAASDG